MGIDDCRLTIGRAGDGAGGQDVVDGVDGVDEVDGVDGVDEVDGVDGVDREWASGYARRMGTRRGRGVYGARSDGNAAGTRRLR